MKHHILVKWTPEVADKKALLPQIQALFDQTLGIDGVHKVELIENVIDRPNRYDLLIRMDMEESALPNYDQSEPHKEWKKTYGPLIEAKAIFDSKE